MYNKVKTGHIPMFLKIAFIDSIVSMIYHCGVTDHGSSGGYRWLIALPHGWLVKSGYTWLYWWLLMAIDS